MADPFDGDKLAEALRTGQPDQLRAAFDRHFDAMKSLASALTGRSDEDVGRLIAEVWTSAVADFPGADPPLSARVWLFERLVDTCVPAPDFEAADHPWEGHWVTFPVPWRPGSLDWARSPEGRAVLERALYSLPDPDRTVLILRDIDGWSAPEMGAISGLEPEDEREVLFRARLAIRAALDPVLREPATAKAAGDG